MSLTTAMLWFDASSKTLEEKIRNASEYFQKKYGKTPTECQVNPKTHPTQEVIAGVMVVPSRSIMPGHLFIGVSNVNVQAGNK